jgi:hypothetical protein
VRRQDDRQWHRDAEEADYRQLLLGVVGERLQPDVVEIDLRQPALGVVDARQ